jgi:hypothetical protein
MAANLLRFGAGNIPCLQYGEEFLSCDEGIQFSIRSGSGYPGSGGCFYGHGKLYLSNLRAIFVPNSQNALFHSFYLPYALLDAMELDKPFLFGDTLVTGICAPVCPHLQTKMEGIVLHFL